MKARIKFRKYGVMKFIGHLDVMRFFQKAMRRAEIPIAFTSGYSPHMIMSFAQPLGLGITSEGEYLDIELTEPVDSSRAVRQLNQVMVPGLDVVNFRQIREEKKYSAMSIVAAADYLILPKEAEPYALTEDNSDSFVFSTDWSDALDAFMHQQKIMVVKKTKHSEKEADIRPLIYDFHLETAGLRLKLATGSENNLKPDLVMNTFFNYTDQKEVPLHYHRTEIYAKDPEKPDGHWLPLDALGTDIVV